MTPRPSSVREIQAASFSPDTCFEITKACSGSTFSSRSHSLGAAQEGVRLLRTHAIAAANGPNKEKIRVWFSLSINNPSNHLRASAQTGPLLLDGSLGSCISPHRDTFPNTFGSARFFQQSTHCSKAHVWFWMVCHGGELKSRSKLSVFEEAVHRHWVLVHSLSFRRFREFCWDSFFSQKKKHLGKLRGTTFPTSFPLKKRENYFWKTKSSWLAFRGLLRRSCGGVAQ